MRKLALVVLATFALLSIGCDVHLQPAVQGEWSNVHKDNKVSKDARPNEETHPEAK